jgi:dTDP-4-amino-4,6-dideoxygalactose transaminase
MILCANPLAQYQSHREEILSAVQRVLDGGHYVLGPEVAALERDFATYCGVPHGIGLNSGTDALILTLRAMGVGPGDEVITVSHTALATVSAVIACGATPVLVDIDPVYRTMDPAGLRAAITDKTRAVIPVHLYGQCADLDAIIAVARTHGLKVIEDCAQSTGAIYHGRRTGSIGDAGCFSFYPTKNLGAIGDGGMVVTHDAELAERVRRLRQYGWDDSRATLEPGLNSRLDEIQAAILNVKLKYLDADNRRRGEIARFYSKRFASTGLQLPVVRPETEHVFHLYVAACQVPEQRDALIRRLADDGVAAGIHYRVPGHLHGGYDARCRLPQGGLPVTESLVGRIFSLPMYPELSIDQAQQAVNCVLDFLASN